MLWQVTKLAGLGRCWVAANVMLAAADASEVSAVGLQPQMRSFDWFHASDPLFGCEQMQKPFQLLC